MAHQLHGVLAPLPGAFGVVVRGVAGAGEGRLHLAERVKGGEPLVPLRRLLQCAEEGACAGRVRRRTRLDRVCLLYTSDAADE